MKTLTLLLTLAVAAPALADKRTDDAIARAEDQLQKGRSDEAVKTLQKLVQQAPGPESYLALARVQARTGAADDAVANATKAADAAGSATPELKADILAGVSTLELRLGARKEAAAHAQAAVQAQATAAALAAQARSQVAAYDVAGALSTSEKAVQAGATNALAHLSRGEALLASGKPAEAVPALNKALELDPKLTMARVRLAAALVAQGQAAAGEAEAKKASEADAQLGEAFAVYGRAILAADPKRWSDAIAQAQQGAFVAPKNASVQVDVGRIFEAQGNLDQASQAYSRALAMDPANGAARAASISVLIRKGEVDKVLPELLKLAEEMPGNGDVQLQLGRLYLRKSDFASALPALEKAASLMPASAEVQAFYGTALHRTGRPAEALEAYTKAIAKEPANADYRTTYGILLGINKKFDEGVVELKKVTALPGYKSPDAFMNLGWIYRNMEPVRTQEAVTAYKRALELDPKNTQAALGIGWVYSYSDDWDNSIAAFNQAMQLDPKATGEANNGIAWAMYFKKDMAQAKTYMAKAKTAGRSDPRLGDAIEKYEKAVAVNKEAAEEALKRAQQARVKERSNDDDAPGGGGGDPVQALSYGSASAKIAGAGQCGSKGGPACVTALIRALQDGNRGVRIAAATALGNIGPAAKSAERYLMQALNSKEPSVVPTKEEMEAYEAEKPVFRAIQLALQKIR